MFFKSFSQSAILPLIKPREIFINFRTKLQPNSFKYIQQYTVCSDSSEKIPELLCYLQFIFEVDHPAHRPSAVGFGFIGIVRNCYNTVNINVFIICENTGDLFKEGSFEFFKPAHIRFGCLDIT